ncbi:MAG: CPBP family intramembrane metalloprotease [Desulfobacteraceae bacterium]|nr:MAG: CPBP family intramembrane metalloprotease [Desulfobacteraceae bacterium]
MAPKTVTLNTALLALAWVVGVEILAGIAILYLGLPGLAVTGAARLIQTALILWVVFRHEHGFANVGLNKADWISGLKAGLIWSAGFGAVAGLGFGIFYLLGYNALFWIRAPLPAGFERGLYFLVGGLIAPIWEEIFFRGVVYGYLRRWGVLIALIATTAVFVLLHSVQGFPLNQIVGGVVFALAYEKSGKLLVPITIHILGNLAIFTLSLL